LKILRLELGTTSVQILWIRIDDVYLKTKGRKEEQLSQSEPRFDPPSTEWIEKREVSAAVEK
jgi:hypothetical protein